MSSEGQSASPQASSAVDPAIAAGSGAPDGQIGESKNLDFFNKFSASTSKPNQFKVTFAEATSSSADSDRAMETGQRVSSQISSRKNENVFLSTYVVQKVKLLGLLSLLTCLQCLLLMLAATLPPCPHAIGTVFGLAKVVKVARKRL